MSSPHQDAEKAAHVLECSVSYFTYSGARLQGVRDHAIDNTASVNTPTQPRRNECTSTSFGVMRLAGSRVRHLSSKSTNDVRSLRSSSFICADEGGISLARKSRVGFEMYTLRTTSWNNPMSNRRRFHIMRTREFTDCSCDPVLLDAVEATHLVEIGIAKFCPFYHLLIESAL
jgi:hypothetical protein